MADAQHITDAFSQGMRFARSDYHLTFGQATAALATLSPTLPVRFDYQSTAPKSAMSYRGYYSDLAFDEVVAGTITVGDFLKECMKALGETFTGYKGGEFLMDEQTPLWVAEYGNCGRAIIGVSHVGGQVILITKEVN